MVKSLKLYVPEDHFDRIKNVCCEQIDVQYLFCTKYEGGYILMEFRCVDKRLPDIVSILSDEGLGVKFGYFEVSSLLMTKPYVKNIKKNITSHKSFRATDRVTVEEIKQVVDSGYHLTFDFVLLICISSLIAAIGMITCSEITIIGAMLFSPLMGPILGSVLGILIQDWEMAKKGFRNEIYGVFLALSMGFIVAIPFVIVGPENWVTFEMTKRGTISSLIPALLVAICCGTGVGLASTSGQMSRFVGVATSTAILPPIVNSGILFFFAIAGIEDNPEWSIQMLKYSGVSISLFLINWFIIFWMSMLFMKYVKKVQKPIEMPKINKDDESLPFLDSSNTDLLLHNSTIN